jgi:hypothetical protein
MFFGLSPLHEIPTRSVKPEFTTYVDPFIAEGFRALMAVGSLGKFKGWSRSYYTLAGHVDSIMSFNKPILPEPSTDEWHTVKEEAFAYFQNLPRVAPLSAKKKGDFDKVKYHSGTSAGYGYNSNPGPHPTHKGPPDGPQHKKAKGIAAKISYECLSMFEHGEFDEYISRISDDSVPDIAFTRTQLAELPNTKIRNVFGECFHYVLLEGLFACPLIDMFMGADTFYFIGKDPVLGVPDLINQLPPRDDVYYLSLDWSKFDSSVQPYEIDLAFDLLESILDFPDTTTRLVFKYVRQLFMKRKVASPDGRVFMRYSGVPSGSYFTHLIDSIVNWIRMRYLFKLFRIDFDTLVTHGDDGFAELLNFHDCLNEMVEHAKTLGWYIKVEKSQLFKDRYRISFLGRSSRHGTNYRDIDRCLRLMYYPEYPVADPQISIARLKAIDEDSSYRIPMIQNVYHYLKTKYGDLNVRLPREFRRYRETYIANVSI